MTRERPALKIAALAAALVVISATALHDPVSTPALPVGEAMQPGAPTLAPIAHIRLCRSDTTACESGAIARTRMQDAVVPGPITLTRSNWRSLNVLNRQVNRRAEASDSHAVAHQKRRKLLGDGWPGHTLLMTQVRTSDGVEHTVLVARTDRGDVVLDSREDAVRPWTALDYRWLKRQSPGNPRRWVRLTGFEADRIARGLVRRERLASHTD